MDISIMPHSPAVINYRTPCLLLLHLSQDLLATESPQMAATEVICSVHQHEVCCIAINQPGTRIATCSAKVRERGRAVTKVTKMFILHPQTGVCVSLPLLSRVLWYMFTAHSHETSLQSSGEGHKLPVSTGEGPLYTHIYWYKSLYTRSCMDTPTGKEV